MSDPFNKYKFVWGPHLAIYSGSNPSSEFRNWSYWGSEIKFWSAVSIKVPIQCVISWDLIRGF